MQAEFFAKPGLRAGPGLAWAFQCGSRFAANPATDDIQDNATLRERDTARTTLAQLGADWDAVPGWTATARALQHKPGSRPSSGALTDQLAPQRQEHRDSNWNRTDVLRRLAAMP